MIPRRLSTYIVALVCGCALSDPPAVPTVHFVDANRGSRNRFCAYQRPVRAQITGWRRLGLERRFFDYNRDGWKDLYVVNGADLPGHVSAVLPKNALYRNDGGVLSPRSAKSLGVAGRGFTAWVASAGDYDNDGDADLFVTNFGRTRLYRNEGSAMDLGLCGCDGCGWDWGGRAMVNTGSSFADYDLDGDLDLYVANYLRYEFERGELSEGGTLRWPRRHLAPTEYPWGAERALAQRRAAALWM